MNEWKPLKSIDLSPNFALNKKKQKSLKFRLRVVDVFDSEVEVESTTGRGHVVSMRINGQRTELVSSVQLQLV